MEDDREAEEGDRHPGVARVGEEQQPSDSAERCEGDDESEVGIVTSDWGGRGGKVTMQGREGPKVVDHGSRLRLDRPLFNIIKSDAMT